MFGTFLKFSSWVKLQPKSNYFFTLFSKTIFFSSHKYQKPFFPHTYRKQLIHFKFLLGLPHGFQWFVLGTCRYPVRDNLCVCGVSQTYYYTSVLGVGGKKQQVSWRQILYRGVTIKLRLRWIKPNWRPYVKVPSLMDEFPEDNTPHNVSLLL